MRTIYNPLTWLETKFSGVDPCPNQECHSPLSCSTACFPYLKITRKCVVLHSTLTHLKRAERWAMLRSTRLSYSAMNRRTSASARMPAGMELGLEF